MPETCMRVSFNFHTDPMPVIQTATIEVVKFAPVNQTKQQDDNLAEARELGYWISANLTGHCSAVIAQVLHEQARKA